MFLMIEVIRNSRCNAQDFSNMMRERYTLMFVVIMFLIINPVISLILSLLLVGKDKVLVRWVAIFFGFSISLFLFKKEYGAQLTATAFDDVASYIYMYDRSAYYSLFDYVFIGRDMYFVGSEPIFRLYLWALKNLFLISDDFFVYLTCFVIVFSLMYAFRLMDERRYLYYFVLYLFASQAGIVLVSSIWRQQLALVLILLGFTLYVRGDKMKGFGFLFMAPLVHVSSVFILLYFVLLEGLERVWVFDRKSFFVFSLILIAIISPLLMVFGSSILFQSGADRLDLYMTGTGDDRRIAFITVLVIGALYLVPALFYQIHKLYLYFVYVFIGGISFMMVYPSANGVFDRIMMYSRPFIGVYLFEFISNKYGANAGKSFAFCVLFFGIYWIDSSNQVLRLLGKGNFFNPVAGIIYMLFV